MKKGTQVSEKIPAANRQYKDTVFRMLFSEKENLLSLYNAVTGNAYQNADDLKIVTLENAIYMGMKNDLAFMLETNIYLYEHQSTLNPNIPLRDLIYIGIEYQQYVDDKSLYSSRTSSASVSIANRCVSKIISFRMLKFGTNLAIMIDVE